MRTIPKERILRVNCAGYGTDAHWNLGRAKSLNNYSAIIVNPVSIAHLFDKDPELVRKVDQCLAEGLTSLTVDDDLLLRNLAAEIDSRVLELSDFLTQGGVLVYFLCRPFVIQGPSLSLDNYYWLESLAPDQPTERNVRHMSAVSHGRLIEPTEDGMASEFAPYLQQHGLEWSTLIRTEYLTEGYSVMAEAGARKCIAGQLFIVESSGKVVFLPSPYSPDFDKTLIECLNNWYEQKEQTPEELEAERSEAHAAAVNAAAAAAQPAAPVGPSFFENDQSSYEPVASAAVDTGASAQQAEPAESQGFSINADQIAESVSQEAKRFEDEVASRSQAEPKKTMGNIDLSIFAQTARQLVQKATEPAAEAAPQAPEAVEQAPSTVTPQPVPAPQSEPAPPVQPAAQGSQPAPRPDLTPAIDTTPSYALPPEEAIQAEPETAQAEEVQEQMQAEDVQEHVQQEPAQAEQVQQLQVQAEAQTSDQLDQVAEDSQTISTGGHSLRNILSHAAPVLPETVMPTAAPTNADLGAPQAGPAQTPSAMAPRTAAALFDDDNEFEDVAQTAPEPAPTDSGTFNVTSAPAPSNNNNFADSGTYNKVTEPTDSGVYQAAASPTDSGTYNQATEETSSGAYQAAEAPTSSGVFGQVEPAAQVPQSMSDSGVFNTPTEAYSAPSLPEQSVETPPQVESTILQPPSGFAATIGGPEEPTATVPPTQPPAQEPSNPPAYASAGDSSVTSNNDPNNHENKSTMDLLRELERAQRPQEQQDTSQSQAPAMTAPPAGDNSSARPSLNNLFKKDASDMAPMDSPLPAVPPAVPQAMPQTAMPPPAPSRNTLGAIMPAAEARPVNPQENFPMMSKDNYMSNLNVPEWCKQYSFSYLDELKKEQHALATQLQDVQAKLNTVESKISSVEQLKCALLSGEGEALKEAVGLVLGKLGWTINHNNATPNEVLLLNVDQPEALVRIVRSDSHCDRSEVASVSGSAIAFWEKHDIEPKGLLIACTWANTNPQQRNQRDYEDAVAEFARKKNLCLMTTLQLIGIYRDLELGLVTQDTVRRQMLETSGCLTGYSVEAGMVGARA